MVTFAVSLVVALSAAVEGFFRFGDRWRHYRSLVEELKSEGWSFHELSGPYRADGATHESAIPHLRGPGQRPARARDPDLHRRDRGAGADRCRRPPRLAARRTAEGSRTEEGSTDSTQDGIADSPDEDRRTPPDEVADSRTRGLADRGPRLPRTGQRLDGQAGQRLEPG